VGGAATVVSTVGTAGGEATVEVTVGRLPWIGVAVEVGTGVNVTNPTCVGVGVSSSPREN
jgi:hypothetical protein